jgi:hypothetical protein
MINKNRFNIYSVINYKKNLKIIVSSAVITAFSLSCAGSHEIIKFDPLVKEKYPAREGIAVKGENNEKFYLKNGYIKLGNLSVKQIRKICFDNCETINHTSESTAVLLKNASQNGGDLVLITQDKVTGSEKAVKNGKCIRSHQVSELQQTWHQAAPGSGQVSYSTSKVVYRTVCDEYEIINGTQEFIISSGSVWRKISDSEKKNNKKSE